MERSSIIIPRKRKPFCVGASERKNFQSRRKLFLAIMMDGRSRSITTTMGLARSFTSAFPFRGFPPRVPSASPRFTEFSAICGRTAAIQTYKRQTGKEIMSPPRNDDYRSAICARLIPRCILSARGEKNARYSLKINLRFTQGRIIGYKGDTHLRAMLRREVVFELSISHSVS